MGFYQNPHKLRDGRILLFQRSDTKGGVWHMRLRVRGAKSYTVSSTGTTSLAEAVQFAEDTYDNLRTRVKEGLPMKTPTFNQYWQYWFERENDTGTWKKHRVRWHQGVFNRYFSPYFGSYPVNEITPEITKGYWAWRIGYWQEGGQGFGERSEHPNAKEKPSGKTLKMEKSALRQIFRDAMENGHIRVMPTIEVPTSFRKADNRRPTFTSHEWATLVSNFDNWCEAKGRWSEDRLTSAHRKQRSTLRNYVYFLANTGMRVGEARVMRWEDVHAFIDPQDGEEKLEIRVRADTKQGKTRTVISQPSAVGYLEKVKEISKFTGPQDYVFASSEGGPRTDFNKTFTKFLSLIPYEGRAEGLLRDADGDKRTLYSLRHYYATTRLEKGDVPLALLAQNMGTSITQLQNHYLHLDVRRQSGTVTRTNKSRVNPKEYDIVMKSVLNLLVDGGEEQAVDMLRRLAATMRTKKS